MKEQVQYSDLLFDYYHNGSSAVQWSIWKDLGIMHTINDYLQYENEKFKNSFCRHYDLRSNNKENISEDQVWSFRRFSQESVPL